MTLYTNPLRNVSPGSMITDHKRHVSEIDGGIITCIDRTSKQVSVPVKLGQVDVYDMVIIHTLFLFEGLVAVEKRWHARWDDRWSGSRYVLKRYALRNDADCDVNAIRIEISNVEPTLAEIRTTG